MLLVEGIISLSTVAVKVAVSVVALPKFTFPLKVAVPETVKLPAVNKLVDGL